MEMNTAKTFYSADYKQAHIVFTDSNGQQTNWNLTLDALEGIKDIFQEAIDTMRARG